MISSDGQNSKILQIKKNLRLSLLEGAFAHIYANLTGGIFLPSFALLLGANSFEIGLLAAIPFLATPTQLLGSLLVEKSKSRKTPAVRFAFFSRILWLPLIMLIYFFVSESSQTLLQIFIIILLSLPS